MGLRLGYGSGCGHDGSRREGAIGREARRCDGEARRGDGEARRGC